MRFETGEGFLCSIGCGIGIGLSSYSPFWFIMGAAAFISLAHVALSSGNYLDYKRKLGFLDFEVPHKQIVSRYLFFQFLMTLFVITGTTFLIKTITS